MYWLIEELCLVSINITNKVSNKYIQTSCNIDNIITIMITYTPHIKFNTLEELLPILSSDDYLDAKENLYNKYSKYGLIRLLQQKKYRYFVTITFNTTAKESESDKNLLRIIKIISKRIFGNRYRQQQRFLQFFVVREEGIYKIKSHYHIMIENHPGITLKTLVMDIIYASQNCNCLSTLYGNDFQKITRKRRSTDHQESSAPNINIVEIETDQDLERISKYVCKCIAKTPGSWAFSSTSKEGYDPIDTKQMS